MGYSSAAEILDDVVVTAGSTASASGVSAGTAAALGAGAAAGIGSGIALTAGSGTTATGGSVPVNSAASTTGPSTSASPGGTSAQPSSSFFGNAVKSALVGGAVNLGTTTLMGGRRGGVTVPPPPGAAMIDPEGAQAAAQIRQRQASAGGLNSTITGAGSNQGSFTSTTSGGKALLGS